MLAKNYKSILISNRVKRYGDNDDFKHKNIYIDLCTMYILWFVNFQNLIYIKVLAANYLILVYNIYFVFYTKPLLTLVHT